MKSEPVSISHFCLFQVGWRITGEWVAGNVACKILLFLRAFGPYLSSNVLVCVSLDRYFAVLHPLRVSDARRRGKSMLAVAWIASLVYCIPQVSVLKEIISFLKSGRSFIRPVRFSECEVVFCSALNSAEFDFTNNPSKFYSTCYLLKLKLLSFISDFLITLCV